MTVDEVTNVVSVVFPIICPDSYMFYDIAFGTGDHTIESLYVVM